MYVDPSADLRPFTKLYFEPVAVIASPNPQVQQPQQIPKDVSAQISQSFLASFRKALEPAYQIVSAPGPDVLTVRSAVTGIEPVKPEAGVVDFLPIKAAYNVGREAAGVGRRVVEMSSEIEVLDPNGKRVGAATATRRGDKTLSQGERITASDMQAITNYWAKNFRTWLDKTRGVTPPPSK